jgi:lysophospholipase L1-like esterase
LGFVLPARHRGFYAVNVVAAYVAIFAAEVYVAATIRPLDGEVRVSMQQWWRNATAKLSDPGKQDRRSKDAVLRDFKAQGIDAVPVIPGSLFLAEPLAVKGAKVIPLAGVSRRMTVNCNEYGVWATYRSDELGFNNPLGLWASQVDLAVLGDSFTYGACVPEGRNLVDRIRADLPATVNLGLGGTGPLLVLARLREYVAPKRPPRVLYVYYEGNDLRDLWYESRRPELMRYVEDPAYRQPLVTRVDEMDPALLAYYNTQLAAGTQADVMGGFAVTQPPAAEEKAAVAGPKLEDIVRLRNLRALFGTSGAACRPEGPYSDDSIALLRRVLSRAKADVESWGGQFSIAYLPEWQSYLEPMHAACFKRRDRIISMAKELGIPLLNVAERIDASEVDRYWFSPQTHFGEEGYARVGEMISAELRGAGR